MNAKIADSEIFRHETAGGIVVERVRHLTAYKGAIETYIDALNGRRGAVFSSNYEYPGRYTRWDTAIVDPPVVITSRARSMRIEALNARGIAAPSRKGWWTHTTVARVLARAVAA